MFCNILQTFLGVHYVIDFSNCLKRFCQFGFLRNHIPYFSTKLDGAFTGMTLNSHIWYPKVRLVFKIVGVSCIPAKNVPGN